MFGVHWSTGDRQHTFCFLTNACSMAKNILRTTLWDGERKIMIMLTLGVILDPRELFSRQKSTRAAPAMACISILDLATSGSG